jgi:hypothetical protein
LARGNLHMYPTWSPRVIQLLLVDSLLFMPKKAAKKPSGSCEVDPD